MQLRALRRLPLVALLPLLSHCGGDSPSTVDAASVAPADLHAIVFQSWSSATSSLELRVQLRKGDEDGDIVQFNGKDGGDSLVADGLGALGPSDDVTYEPGFVPSGLHYVLKIASTPNQATTIHWYRAGAEIAAIPIQPVNAAEFKSYEYCHVLSGDNYGLVRFDGAAPDANETVCAELRLDCYGTGCTSERSSCSVDDYRVRIVENDQELDHASTAHIRVLRTTRVDGIAGFKSAVYQRRFDTGEHDASGANICVKQN